jgi:hypothetical protein
MPVTIPSGVRRRKEQVVVVMMMIGVNAHKASHSAVPVGADDHGYRTGAGLGAQRSPIIASWALPTARRARSQ